MKCLRGKPAASSPIMSKPAACQLPNCALKGARMACFAGGPGGGVAYPTSDPLWPLPFELDALVQRGLDPGIVERARRAVNDLESAKVTALGGHPGLEPLHLVNDDTHDTPVVDGTGAVVVVQLVAGHEVGPDLGVLDVVAHKVLEAELCVSAVGRLVVEQAFHHAGPPVELLPRSAVELAHTRKQQQRNGKGMNGWMDGCVPSCRLKQVMRLFSVKDQLIPQPLIRSRPSVVLWKPSQEFRKPHSLPRSIIG